VYHTESAFRFQVRMTTLVRPLRADARRNREKVLAAARAVFAEQGVDAQMDDVARRADVGVGTVYRHFPTKEALLNALTDELFAVIAVHTRTLLTLDDPWEAFTRALWFAADKTAGDRAFTEIMAAQRKFPARTCPGKEDLTVTVGELMDRCKAAGVMRQDAMVEDVGLLMCGVGSASQMEHPVPGAWRRHMAIVLDGLRAPAASGELHR
jgi:AcrR family transcriptional regulator